MAINFPDSPADGDTHTVGSKVWTYNATKGAWIASISAIPATLGEIDGHIIPDTNVTYDLGSAEKKFRDLYLSTGTLYIGEQAIQADTNGVVVNALKVGTSTISADSDGIVVNSIKIGSKQIDTDSDGNLDFQMELLLEATQYRLQSNNLQTLLWMFRQKFCLWQLIRMRLAVTPI